MRASYFHFARCKYVPTILSESLAQARVAGTLRAQTERKMEAVTPINTTVAVIQTSFF